MSQGSEQLRKFAATNRHAAHRLLKGVELGLKTLADDSESARRMLSEADALEADAAKLENPAATVLVAPAYDPSRLQIVIEVRDAEQPQRVLDTIADGLRRARVDRDRTADLRREAQREAQREAPASDGAPDGQSRNGVA